MTEPTGADRYANVAARLYANDVERDLHERWAPSEDQLAAASRYRHDEGVEDVFVALVQPGKQHGVWTIGQAVEVVAGPAGELVWGDRNEAVAHAEAQLFRREGTVSYVRVRADGTWAVFEEV